MITEYIAFVKESGYFDHKRLRQSKYWMYESINDQLKSHFYNNKKIDSLLSEYEGKVVNNKISSFIAAKELLDSYFGK
jgi:LAO/AO transport system kinase